MTIFRILECDRKPRIALKRGFCWPAVIFGVFWALYKCFWPAAVVLLGLTIAVNAFVGVAMRTDSALLSLASFLFSIGVAYLVGRYANFAYLAYLTSKGYRVVNEISADTDRPEQALRVLDETRSLTVAVQGRVEESGTNEPLGLCPNCNAPTPLSAVECLRCNAQFGSSSGWQVRPIGNA